MIEKTIGEIEAKIRGAEAVSEERKRELLQLLGRLKTEVGALEKRTASRRKASRVSRKFPRTRPRAASRIRSCANFPARVAVIRGGI